MTDFYTEINIYTVFGVKIKTAVTYLEFSPLKFIRRCFDLKEHDCIIRGVMFNEGCKYL